MAICPRNPRPLALQFGGGVVKFRNVWIRPPN